jgi:hypothetical protein
MQIIKITLRFLSVIYLLFYKNLFKSKEREERCDIEAIASTLHLLLLSISLKLYCDSGFYCGL